MDTFWFISIIVTPTPKIVKLHRIAKIIIIASKQNIWGELLIYGCVCVEPCIDKKSRSKSIIAEISVKMNIVTIMTANS